MTDQTDAIAQLLARDAIWQVLLRYTRGIDRLDRELALSAFHADARIDQGSIAGTRETFVDWVLAHHREHQLISQHMMTNFNCEVSGSTAHAETYVSYYGVNRSGDDSFAVGRYVDRLDCCDGRWTIVDRVCMTEGATDFTRNTLVAQFAPAAGSIALSQRSKADPSYLRPLQLAR